MQTKSQRLQLTQQAFSFHLPSSPPMGWLMDYAFIIHGPNQRICKFLSIGRHFFLPLFDIHGGLCHAGTAFCGFDNFFATSANMHAFIL